MTTEQTAGHTTKELDATLPAGTTVAPTAAAVSHGNRFTELLALMGNKAPLPSKHSKSVVAPSTTARMRSICPEVTDGLLDANGKPREGTISFKDTKGAYGPKDALYLARLVELRPADHAFILKEFGEGNRDPIPARQKEVIRKQKDGEWQFVFNTIVFTVDEIGNIMPNSFEQHNGGHGGRGTLESGIGTLYLVCFGVPKSARDKIDDNAARSAKDIASTRSELKEFFAPGTVIGGAVMLTEPLSKKCKAALTEALRIVDDVRHGLLPKSGGARDKVDVGNKLDVYGEALSKSVGMIVALDSKSPTTGKEGKVKASGGLTKRIPLNHAVAFLTLAASHKDANTGLITFDEEEAWNVMAFLTLIGAEAIDDDTLPAVALRNTIDRWNVKKLHDGTDGKNVRFAALKKAYLMHVDDVEVKRQDAFELIKGSDCNNKEAGLCIGGIDDYVDDTAARMAAAASAPAVSDEPLPLIPEDEEMASDVPDEEVDA